MYYPQPIPNFDLPLYSTLNKLRNTYSETTQSGEVHYLEKKSSPNNFRLHLLE
jgi:hypothetical protein